MLACVGAIDGCTAIVAERGEYCASCAPKYAAETRHSFLSTAVASLPDIFAHARAGDPWYAKRVHPKIREAVAGWERGNVCIHGPTRVGKTAGAVALCHRIIDAALMPTTSAVELGFAAGIRYVFAADLALAARESALGSRPRIVVEAETATLLVLDEMGLLDTRGDIGAIQSVLDRRYRRAGAVTVVTRPLRPRGKFAMPLPPSFEQLYGDATVARLSGIGAEVEVNETEARKWLDSMRDEGRNGLTRT